MFTSLRGSRRVRAAVAISSSLFLVLAVAQWTTAGTSVNSITPASVEVIRGSAATYTVNVDNTSNSNDHYYKVSSVATLTNATFTSNCIHLNAGAAGDITVTINTTGTTPLGTSTLTFTARQFDDNTCPGNGSNPASGTASLSVKLSTTTTLSTSGSPSTYGSTVTFTSTVSPSAASGTVSFYEGATLLGTSAQTTGSRTLPISTLSVGSHSITAKYAGNSSYANSTSSVVVQVVGQATATCTVTGYTVTYNAASHTATGSCTGVGGVTLSGLTLSGTTHTNAGVYTDSWSFHDASGNYADRSGTVTDTINKATPTCTVTGYSVTYNGAAHTATGSCTGVGGVTLTGLDLSATTHTAVGTYNGDAWSLHDAGGNYADRSGTVNDSIGVITAVCTITGYTVTYDAASHTATGSCKDVEGANLPGLTLSGTTHTNAGVYTDSWSFHDADGLYGDQSGTVTDTIDKAPLTITASNGAMAEGGTPPVITPLYSGWVNGDTAASLTTPPTCTTTATSSSAVGTYPSTCSGAVDRCAAPPPGL